MKKGLLLYGANCTLDVWNEIKETFVGMSVTFIQYPHEITQNAHSISDITKWVFEEYGNEPVDFIIGHSMGGLIALELVVGYKIKCSNVIFIESNLRPANEFYRNLMLPINMTKYGDKILKMIKSEATYYGENLKSSLQNDFDYTKYINEISCKVYGIYGDRGMENYDKRIDDLCLDRETKEKIDFKFIRNSCHMPMIENPKELVRVLMKCIK